MMSCVKNGFDVIFLCLALAWIDLARSSHVEYDRKIATLARPEYAPSVQ